MNLKYRKETSGYSTRIGGRRIRVEGNHTTGLNTWSAKYAGVVASGPTRDDAVQTLLRKLDR